MTFPLTSADGVGAAARYHALETARRPFLERAREAARLTTPTLLPPEGGAGGRDLATPFQGVGARGVNNLANKLLLAQFPPNAPFFRLTVDPDGLAALTATDAKQAAERAAPLRKSDTPAATAGQEGLVAAVEAALADIERTLAADFETGFLRAGLHACLKQLIVAGNCLLHVNPDGGARAFRLDRYVVKRDPMGRVLEIVVRETVAAETLPEETAAMSAARRATAGRRGDQTIDLFTWIRRDRDHWSVVQEALDQELPGSRGRYPLDRLDWLALRWSHVDGEDYGRSHVEEYVGDLRSLEGLMQAIVEGAAAASRMTVLVAPNGQTDAEELAEAENGAIIDGIASDVSILQANKLSDFRVAFEAVEMLTKRLSFAFLLGDGANAGQDRATAEEIRFMAAELEDALGGVYSVLAEELQRPLVELLMAHRVRRGALPGLPSGVLRPEIVTGLDALGRGKELERLSQFIDFAVGVGRLSTTPLGDRLDLPGLIIQGGRSLGVNVDALLRAPAGPSPVPSASPAALEAPFDGASPLGALAAALGRPGAAG